MKKFDMYDKIDLSKCRYLGRGRNGKVYLLPDEKVVIKICNIERSCIEEYRVLKIAEGSSYFPKIYGRYGKMMFREYVGGEKLPIYLRKKNLSRNLAISLIGLIDEFRILGFRRLDIRGEHIYVQNDERVMVIDPAGQMVKSASYPKSMIKELKRQKCIKSFYDILKEERPDLYKRWKR